MGPVGLPGDAVNTLRAADGTPMASAFELTFDRPVDPATFTTGDVQVFFRGTDPSNQTPQPVPVMSVTPLNTGAFGPAGAVGTTRFRVAFQPTRRVGTYSYAVGPNIQDRIRTTQVSVVSSGNPTTFTPAPNQQNLPLPPSGVGGSGNPALDVTRSTIAVTGFPMADVVADVNVTLSLNYPFSGDLNISLVSPDGVRSTLVLYRPGFGGGGNTGGSFPNTSFDDDDPNAQSLALGGPPYIGVFRPEVPLSIFDGGTANGTWTLEVSDDFPADVGTFLTWSLTVTSGTIVPGGTPGNMMDQDADAIPGEAGNDAFAAPRSLSGTPLAAPFDPLTLPLIVPGPGVAGTHVPNTPTTADNLVTDRPVNALDVTFDRDMQVASFTRADVLRIVGPEGSIDPATITVTPVFNSANAGPIPDNPSTPLVSMLDLSGVGGAFGIGDLNVRLSITHPRVADLTIVLIAPGGQRIPLVLAGSVSGQNFADTTFDDEAALALAQAPAPFTGSFRPAMSWEPWTAWRCRGSGGWRSPIPWAATPAGRCSS